MAQNCKPILTVDANGRCMPSGFGYQNGQLVRLTNPTSWAAPLASQVNQNQYAVLAPEALAQQINANGQGGGLIPGAFQRTDIPGAGQTGVLRMEQPANVFGSMLTYTLILDNTQALSVSDYVLIGDVADTYKLTKNITLPVVGSTMTIDGDFLTDSLSVLTKRMAARAMRIDEIKIEALSQAYFNQNPITYFDTTPTPDNVVENRLSLSELTNASQFNPTIQVYKKSQLFDGVNGLYIRVPRLEKIILTFSIVSENRASAQVLVN